jgi:hypothetical protein
MVVKVVQELFLLLLDHLFNTLEEAVAVDQIMALQLLGIMAG